MDTKELNVLIKSNLSFNEYFVLQHLKNEEELGKISIILSNSSDSLEDVLKRLEEKEFIIGKEYRTKGLKLFNNYFSLEELVKEYTEIFPEGKDEYGIYRGDRRGSLKKFRTFMSKYGRKYTKDDILKATKKYVSRYKPPNYAGITRAHNFISKGSVSLLLAELENLNEETIEQQEPSSTYIG